MIRFRTVDPTQPEKPAPQPALVQAVAAAPAEAESTSVAPATRKGLVRKAPLRAKAAKTAPLFEK
ncbi:hypothetical protein QO058_23990 [Bosea vestrisii]|uniref:hypothetical protein n=1 Tax=Bosea vestrisii TaxID=151416 RepID=UPI0024DF4FFB|nr:hypothetical protein [Bosea vestrisii]WID95782.1 hypothetical protein QO058_23990 [Bosea vestrisii]